MENRVILIAAALSALYFGVQFLRILPISLRLVQALWIGKVRWPGSPTHDPDSRIRLAEQWLCSPPQYLFPSFFKHALGVLAAFVLSTIITLNYFFFWLVPLPGRDWIVFGLLLFAVVIGGCLYLKRALYYLQIIKTMLSE